MEGAIMDNKNSYVGSVVGEREADEFQSW